MISCLIIDRNPTKNPYCAHKFVKPPATVRMRRGLCLALPYGSISFTAQLALPFLAPWDFPIFSSPSAPHTCPQVAGLSAQLNEYRPRWPHLLLLQLLLHLEQYGAMTVFVSSWCQNLSRNAF